MSALMSGPLIVSFSFYKILAYMYSSARFTNKMYTRDKKKHDFLW